MPTLQAKMAAEQETDRRLREDYGVHVNYVRPIKHQGHKVWAIGSRVYLNRRPDETFHEFALDVLRETLGEPWRAEQAALPEEERHFVLRCFERLGDYKARYLDPEEFDEKAVVSAPPNGWLSYLMSLAWDVTTVIHAGGLPDQLLTRLRHPEQYQGARYELAIAGIFARLDCQIRFLDDEQELRGAKRVEFEATHRPSGQILAVETKSRHRTGVINQRGEADPDDSRKRDPRMVRQLFVKATEKVPEGLPFFIFIDMNAPLGEEIDQQWMGEVERWMSRLPQPTEVEPAAFNALYVTNFSPHYDGDDISIDRRSWLEVSPPFVREQLDADLVPALRAALATYGRVPPIDEGGLLD
jgi:hypothetical protein